MNDAADIVVIGAGIAGASAAAAMAADARVILLEREDRPGLHATGRSAAQFLLTYGGPVIQPLSRASLPTFEDSPASFVEGPLLKRRGFLIFAPSDQLPILARKRADAPCDLSPIGPTGARERFPLLRPDAVADAVYDETAADIDVDALHQAYLRQFRACGGQVVCSAEVDAIERTASGWIVRARDRRFTAEIVVNAAGAWGDRIAALARIGPLGLRPKRRTAALIDAPDGVDAWPLLMDAAETFYLKPDSGRFLLSPADETDVEPHDAYADDEALAGGVARMEAALDLAVTKRPQTWAGLRTFTRDRAPAVGFDPHVCDFYWLVGQGGFGVQTAPALAALAASQVARRPPPDALIAAGVDPDRYSPARFRN